MKIDRVRPLVAFALVALASAAVLVAGLQTGPLAGVVRRAEPSGFAALDGSSALLGSVLEARPPSAVAPQPVTVSVVRTVTPTHVRSTPVTHHGRAVAKAVGHGATTPAHRPIGKGHHAAATPVVTDRVDVALVTRHGKHHGRRTVSRGTHPGRHQGR